MSNEESNNEIPNIGGMVMKYREYCAREKKILSAIDKLENKKNLEIIKGNDDLKQHIFDLYDELKEE